MDRTFEIGGFAFTLLEAGFSAAALLAAILLVMLLVAPDAQVAAKEIAAKDVVFVFDTSGSMAGEKIEQARRALLTLLNNLNPNDRFNIITFSSDTRPFRGLAPSANA